MRGVGGPTSAKDLSSACPVLRIFELLRYLSASSIDPQRWLLSLLSSLSSGCYSFRHNNWHQQLPTGFIEPASCEFHDVVFQELPRLCSHFGSVPGLPSIWYVPARLEIATSMRSASLEDEPHPALTICARRF